MLIFSPPCLTGVDLAQSLLCSLRASQAAAEPAGLGDGAQRRGRPRAERGPSKGIAVGALGRAGAAGPGAGEHFGPPAFGKRVSALRK